MKRVANETDYFKTFFATSSRKDSLDLIQNSCLTDKERDIIISRFIEGLNIKEMCQKYNVEESTYKHSQKRILVKLYNYINIV
jgi:DNA-directed RNA polymerase specialized sigma subunit